MRSEVRRPLRPTEKWYWIADQVSPVTGVARVNVRGHVPPDLLEQAAAALAAEHPLLRVSIAADVDGRNPAFVPCAGGAPIRRVTGDDVEWEHQVQEHELGTPLDWHHGPLFRIVDVVLDTPDEEHDLLLVVSHIIADGITALSLLQGLIEHADRLSAATDLDAIAESRPALGAPEDLLPARYRGVRGVARLVASTLADQVVATMTRPRRLAPELAVPQSQRKTRLLRRTLSAAQLDALAWRCRAEGVTVHGALAAATAMAVGPIAVQRDSGRIWIGTPVDIRSELDPAVTAKDVGAYVAMSNATLRFGGDRDLWSIARQVNRSARRRNRIGQHLALVYAMRFLCPESAAKSRRIFGLVDRYGPGNVCVTNMGRYPFPDRIGDWQCSGAQLAVNTSISGYFVAIINTSHHELFWNFVYVEDVVSERSARHFADGCVRTLLAAIDCDTSVAVSEQRV